MITIAHIFYNQHKLLPFHQKAWASHPPNKAYYTIIDDASPNQLTSNLLHPNLSIYRVEQDIPWNIAGARNLAFYSANTDWVLCADIDHIVTPEAFAKISQLPLDNKNIAYTFRRKEGSGYVGVDAIINILISKETFFSMGGYDEDFSGHYGREETFFLHCLKYKKIRILRCDDIFLDWYPRLGRTELLPRGKEHNDVFFQEKMELLKQGNYKNGPLLRFDWHLVDTPFQA